MDTESYISNLQSYLKPMADPANATPMKKYMKGRFDYLGIKSPERKELLKSFIKEYGLPDWESLSIVTEALWNLPYREYQYCAMEIADKSLKHVDRDFHITIEYMILNKSWWDSVDFIAASLAGKYFKRFTEFIPNKTNGWSISKNIWLNRSAILYQLKYKKDTNTDLLERYIKPHTGSKEFFIKKAIGWSLREYSKTNGEWVRQFISNNELQPLSIREGLKWLNR